MTPCESWPTRLASTRCSAIRAASAAEQPAARKMDLMNSFSRPAGRFITRLSLMASSAFGIGVKWAGGVVVLLIGTTLAATSLYGSPEAALARSKYLARRGSVHVELSPRFLDAWSDGLDPPLGQHAGHCSGGHAIDLADPGRGAGRLARIPSRESLRPRCFAPRC